MSQSMGREEANRTSAVDDGAASESDVIDGYDPEAIEDPETYLREDMTLQEFEEVVSESETILEIQKKTRMPRWKVKRLLHHTDMRRNVASTAQHVAALREEDD